MGGFNSYTALLDRVESKAFYLINSSSLTDCLQSLSLIAAMLHLLLFSTAIFMLTALLILLTACLPSFFGLAALDFPLSLTPILSKSLMQELTSILNLSSLSLVNSGTPYLPLFFQLPMTWTYSRGRFQDTYPHNFGHPLSLYRDRQLSGPFFFLPIFCCPWPAPLLHKKKKNLMDGCTQDVN